MTNISLQNGAGSLLGSMVFFLNKRIQKYFKARSYNATVLELYRMPASMLKGIGMDHSNVDAKTYESIFGKE